MPLRTEMPASVMKPTSAATDSGWPDSHRPITAPTRASGMFTMISADSAADL
jgi:hypothetical protein